MAGEVIDIDIVKRNLKYRIQQFRQLPAPHKTELWYLERLNRVAKDFREYGICLFLSELSQEGLYACFSHSADSRITLLNMAENAVSTCDRYAYLSNNASFFDALAANQWDKGLQIAKLSHCPFNEDYEYADDYRYTAFLFKLLLADFRLNKSFNRLLEQLLEDMEGEILARYSLCEALLQGDEQKFSAALSDLIDEHADHYEAEAERVVDHYRFRTQQYVFIEGLALRKIGKKMGFSLNDELRFMPIVLD